ncbi:MAG: HDOD domain-containing protein [Thermoguttaceae bacterium]
MNDPGNTLDRIAAKACRLLSLPTVAMKVLELTESSKVDTAALKECLEADPALTSKVLRVVNSSLYGLCREVSDLNQALALLGTKPLKLLVLGFSLPAGLFEGIVGDVLLRYWRHTLVKAVAAREIAEKFWRRSGDEPFIAGLLQDLGALLLIQELGEPYVRFLQEVADHRADVAELERQSLGFEHTQLTAQLLRHWKLPASLVLAVGLSEPPPADRSASLTAVRQILRLAELVAALLADGRPDALAQLLKEGHAACGIGRQAVEDLVAGLEAKVRQLAETLNVDVAGGADYGSLLREAHLRLVDIAEEVAGDLAGAASSPPTGRLALGDILADLAHAAVDAGSPSATCQAGPAASAPVVPPGHGAVDRHAPQAPTATVQLGGARQAAYVATAAAACRQARCPMSLLLVEMSDPGSLALALGRQGFLEVRSRIGRACRDIEHEQRACMPYGDAGFLVILSNCERQSAVRLGQALIRSVHRQSGPVGPPIGVSVGVASVALPPVNFDPELMLDSADRCLYGARASGGSMVKSIEIY